MKSILRRALVAVLRRAPIKSGVTAIAFHPLVQWLLADLPETIATTLRDGTPIIVSPHDHDGSILYLFGTNDPKVAATASALLHAEDRFLDIGANYATIGLGVARRVAAVHLFEPQQRLGDRIAGAIAAGGFRAVTLHRIGLMDVDGSFTLRSPRDHSGTATFIPVGENHYYDTSETCTVRAIADYLAPLIADRPFAAKVDVEGAEPHILPWLFAQPNLRFVIFEAANNTTTLYDQVRTAGLMLYGLVRHPVLMRYSRIDNVGDVQRFHDVIAINASGPGPRSMGRRGLNALVN